MTNRELLIKALNKGFEDPQNDEILFERLNCPTIGRGCPRPDGDDTSCYECMKEWLDKETK